MRTALASAVALIAFAGAAPAFAVERCRVTDPTGTPLNVREANMTITGGLRMDGSS